MDAVTFPIIILAAGAARRMRGRDKLMEEIGGVPLLRLQIAKARCATSGPVLVTLPAPPHRRYDALTGTDALAVPVPDAGEGMNASLRRAIAALPPDTPCAMVLLGDLPDLTGEDLSKVAHAVDPTSGQLIWRGVTETGKDGHPIVFHADLFAAFATLRGDSGGREIIPLAGKRICRIPLPGQNARRDLDTPEDWDRWRADNP